MYMPHLDQTYILQRLLGNMDFTELKGPMSYTNFHLQDLEAVPRPTDEGVGHQNWSPI